MIWKKKLKKIYNRHYGDGAWRMEIARMPSFVIRREDYEAVLLEILRMFGSNFATHIDGIEASYDGDKMERREVSKELLKLREEYGGAEYEKLAPGVKEWVKDRYYRLVDSEEFAAHPEKRPFMEGANEVFDGILSILGKYARWERR